MARKKYHIPDADEINEILKRRNQGMSDKPTVYNQRKEHLSLEQILAQNEQLKFEVDKKLAEMKRGVGHRSHKELREMYGILLERYNFSAAEDLIHIAIGLRDQPEMIETRVNILQKLMEYEIPKLKSVEITGSVEHQHTVVVVRWGEDGSVQNENLQDPGKQVIDVGGTATQGERAELMEGVKVVVDE